MKLPEEIHRIIHEYLKLPFSISITNNMIKNTFCDNNNLKIIFFNDEHTFIDNYKNDLRKLYFLIKKYDYYEYWCKEREPIRTILIDMLCTECSLPFALSSHSIFTDDIFNDIKEIIRIVPQSLQSQYGQLRCRYKLSPLDIACHNVNIPLNVIEYILDKGANMYYLYEVNGYKTHILDDIDPGIASIFACERYEKIKQIFLEKGFDNEKLINILSLYDE